VTLDAAEEMHIEVTGRDDSSNAQARAYAEYRLFAALARHTQAVRSACIELERVSGEGSSNDVLCAVTVNLRPSGVARARAIGGHAYAAIDRAVKRVRKLMTDGTAQSLST
jgi:ribosome-associated translation inhibitor RaiA